MKTVLYPLILISLGLLLSSCGATPPPDTTQLAASMKGYELYSWQAGDHWAFSLLAGTNREKTLDEIKAAHTTLTDVDALMAMLKKVPAGQYITWSSRDTLSLPPENIIKQVEQTCRDKGLILNIAK